MRVLITGGAGFIAYHIASRLLEERAELTLADISKSRRVLGYDPKVPIHDGIRRFANWFLESKR
jgi:nucleoside-diphosphate-sugar epimerase